MNKIEALAGFLGIEKEELKEIEKSFYEVKETGESYMVFSDEEATEEAKKEVEKNLFFFNPIRILNYTKNAEIMTEEEKQQFIDGIAEAEDYLGEDKMNAIIKGLIEDLDEFIDDTLLDDGRGLYLSDYDQDEHQYGEYFIYRE